MCKGRRKMDCPSIPHPTHSSPRWRVRRENVWSKSISQLFVYCSSKVHLFTVIKNISSRIQCRVCRERIYFNKAIVLSLGYKWIFGHVMLALTGSKGTVTFGCFTLTCTLFKTSSRPSNCVPFILCGWKQPGCFLSSLLIPHKCWILFFCTMLSNFLIIEMVS